ncbi:23S rRNA (uracil(1939)-C(5))-methyltransferase RlmD [Bacilliculturomica massiliensis]|uniref:23S rRNA (uracil(1939)-C(5))-methyltransferase RlmD n=1 Tax=Bacilliculturomica massiliensis TaxID=1917867 RepID=UPI001031A90C|nr:23S rRNA (uracil(1939)-C(5))-methyltransferase RlmD [Bacilliculturomica massiliensis]
MEICKHNDVCGGCIYQEIPYEEQMTMKAREVVRLLENKGVRPERFLGVEGSPLQYGYRNKMEYTFGDEVKDGEMTLGMHKRGRFMSIVTVDQCQLVAEDFNKVLRATLDFCTDRGYDFYHKKAHRGLMRNLILRRGVHTGELLVNIVTSSEAAFDGEGYVARLQELDLSDSLVGVLHTYNDGLADAVGCDRLEILFGRDHYMEEIMGLKFKVSAFSFFQTNVMAVEKLYTEAIALIDGVEGKTVFDLYCGTGTITQALAQQAKEAIGVEIVPEAVEAARENARLNGLDNCRFIEGDVLKALSDLEEKPDVIVVDPPRMGIHPKALQKILNYGVNQIVYISCNPKTLAENLEMVRLAGYAVKILKVFDNFPHTKHIESIVLLQKDG